MFRPSRSSGLSPFRRRLAVALLASLAGAFAARLLGPLVPGPDESAALGGFLFTVAIQAAVAALVWPFADRAVPPPADDGADSDA